MIFHDDILECEEEEKVMLQSNFDNNQFQRPAKQGAALQTHMSIE